MVESDIFSIIQLFIFLFLIRVFLALFSYQPRDEICYSIGVFMYKPLHKVGSLGASVNNKAQIARGGTYDSYVSVNVCSS